MNCAAANSGADAGMYDASSEQYKLSTIIKVMIYITGEQSVTEANVELFICIV